MTFDDLKADFQYLDDWEDRYKYLIDLGNQLPAFDESDKVPANKVHGCVSQVWVKPRIVETPAGDLEMHFTGDSDALIVRGLLFVLYTLMSGRPVSEIAEMNPQKELQHLDLQDHLTQQRSNGLNAMINRLADLARHAQ